MILSIFSCACWLFLYIFVKCPIHLPILKLGVSSLYIVDGVDRSMFCRYFIPTYGLHPHFSHIVFQRTKFLICMMLILAFYCFCFISKNFFIYSKFAKISCFLYKIYFIMIAFMLELFKLLFMVRGKE